MTLGTKLTCLGFRWNSWVILQSFDSVLSLDVTVLGGLKLRPGEVVTKSI